MFSPNFSKIDQSGGLLLLFFHQEVPKIQNEKISSTWKLLKLTLGGGVNFGSRKMILDIKTNFFKAKPILGK